MHKCPEKLTPRSVTTARHKTIPGVPTVAELRMDMFEFSLPGRLCSSLSTPLLDSGRAFPLILWRFVLSVAFLLP